MSKRTKGRLIISCIAIPLVLTIANIGIKMHQRYLFNQQAGITMPAYVKSRYPDYDNRVPIEEINYDSMRFGDIMTDMPSYEDVKRTVVLPGTITYYTKQNGRYIKEFSIMAGSEVHWLQSEQTNMSLFYELTYGIMSYPTYDAGWRYARPFLTADDELIKNDYFYVRLSDLHAVAMVICKDEAIDQYFSEYLYNTKHREYKYMRYDKPYARDLAEYVVKYTDKMLFLHGIYISKDYHEPLWKMT